MITLLWRQVKKTAAIQLALAVLFASAVTIFLVYSSYISRENMLAGARTISRIPAGHILVQTNTVQAALPSTPQILLIGGWNESLLNSNVGELACALVGSEGSLGALAPKGTILIPKNLARRYNLSAGDEVALYQQGRPFIVNVHGVYNSTSDTQGYDFGNKVIVFTGTTSKYEYVLHQNASNNMQNALNTLKRTYLSATVIQSYDDVTLGTLVAKSSAAVVAQSKMSLVFFVAVAFLTAKVLGFMDNRRVLAILKAIGLKHGEVSRFMFWDAFVSPLVGAIVGSLFGKALLAWLSNHGAGLGYSQTLLLQSLVALLPAIIVGVYVPARFARMASVNELAHERSIPLFHEQIDSLKRRMPALDPYTAQGIHFIKLDVVGGSFEGIIFRKLGDTVRKGEVMASATSWWGLMSKDYLAPITGTIVYYQKEAGVLGVGPA